jgi:hypothetical protein
VLEVRHVIPPPLGHRAQFLAVDILENATSRELVERYAVPKATAVRLIQRVRCTEAS